MIQASFKYSQRVRGYRRAGALVGMIAASLPCAAKEPADNRITLSPDMTALTVAAWRLHKAEERGVTQVQCCGSMEPLITAGDVALLQRYRGEAFPDNTIVCIKGVMHRVTMQRGDSVMFSPDAAPLKAVWKRRSEINWIVIQLIHPTGHYSLKPPLNRG